MSDTLKRWECPECGQECGQEKIVKHRVCYMGKLCPGVPVERVYVAVDVLLSDGAARACAERVFEDPPESLLDDDYDEARDGIRAAIAAVTGGNA